MDFLALPYQKTLRSEQRLVKQRVQLIHYQSRQKWRNIEILVPEIACAHERARCVDRLLS